jgi:hypothetical protein
MLGSILVYIALVTLPYVVLFIIVIWAALTLPKTRKGKVEAVLGVVGACVTIFGLWYGHLKYENYQKQEAQRIEQELEASSNEFFIYHTAESVDGVLLSGYWEWKHIESLLTRYRYVDTVSYDNVDDQDGENFKRFRYTTEGNSALGTKRFHKTLAPDPAPRYSVIYNQNIDTPYEGTHCINGNLMKVIDLQTNEVMAEWNYYGLNETQKKYKKNCLSVDRPSVFNQFKLTDHMRQVIKPSLTGMSLT